MTSFELQLPKHIVFGRGKAPETLKAAMAAYERPFLVHGANATRVSWAFEFLAHASTFACDREPDVSMLENAVRAARDAKSDVIIGIGGGAVIDLAKAVAGLLRTKRPLTTYLEVIGEGQPLDAQTVPFIAVPTTAGTGAEATKNAVIGVPEHRRKVSIRDTRMLADLAIVDPALTDQCPRAVTLAGGLDAITQLIEPFLSLRANTFTDALVRQALPPALTAIQVLAEREDEDARDAMAFASHMSGICLAHAGLGAVHGFAGVIGGVTGAPHGEICATLLAPVLKANRHALVEQNSDLAKIREVEALLGKAFSPSNSDDSLDVLESWIHASGVRSLGEMGVEPASHESIVEMAKVSSSMKSNPIPLSSQVLADILASA